MKTYVLILAGGKGTRMNAAVNKVLIPLCGKTVLLRSVLAFSPFADEMVIVCRPEDRSIIFDEISRENLPFPVCFAPGGHTRQGSVRNGISVISPHPDDIILIHDAARCLVDNELIRRVIQSVTEHGTGVPGIPVTSTYKICDKDSFVISTPERASLYEIQTPQGFTAGIYLPLIMKASEKGLDFTDDAGLLEYYHSPVKIIRGSSDNIKLTLPDDLKRARTILEGDDPAVRIGMGYDVHRLVKNRNLVLCGVSIPYEYGLLGHSDADVALHALMDAMLGACALGDIGRHFPDTDDCYSGISSLVLLRETCMLLKKAGYQPANIDITIVAQKPKLLPYIPQMAENIASVLKLSVSSVNVKATTTEQLGFEGRMEGISAYAVCTVIRIESGL